MSRLLLRFFWEGVPPKSTFQQRDRNFHPTPQARLARATLTAIAQKYAPPEPLNGVLGIRAIFTWPHTRESARLRGGLPVRKTTRPDGVNLLKGLEDCMTAAGFWKDDSLLAVEHVERWHGDVPGIAVVVSDEEEVNPTP